MPFWKKPEDPWDIDPSRRRKAEEREPLENPLDSIRAWTEKRKSDAAAREAERAALPNELCPRCGQEMERGYLVGGRGITWYPGFYTTRAKWIGPPKELRDRQLRVDSEGDLATYQTAWICQACQKMVLDTANMKHPDGCSFWDNSPDLPPEEEASTGEEPEESP